jgi:hypothetical protein
MPFRIKDPLVNPEFEDLRILGFKDFGIDGFRD